MGITLKVSDISDKVSPSRDSLWYDDDVGDAGHREPQAGTKHSVESGVLVELPAHELHEGEEDYANPREHSVQCRSLTEIQNSTVINI